MFGNKFWLYTVDMILPIIKNICCLAQKVIHLGKLFKLWLISSFNNFNSNGQQEYIWGIKVIERTFLKNQFSVQKIVLSVVIGVEILISSLSSSELGKDMQVL